MRKERLSTRVVADMVEEEAVGVRVVEYPVEEHEHSLKVIRHTIDNVVAMFREAFAFHVVEDRGEEEGI